MKINWFVPELEAHYNRPLSLIRQYLGQLYGEHLFVVKFVWRLKTYLKESDSEDEKDVQEDIISTSQEQMVQVQEWDFVLNNLVQVL